MSVAAKDMLADMISKQIDSYIMMCMHGGTACLPAWFKRGRRRQSRQAGGIIWCMHDMIIHITHKKAALNQHRNTPLSHSATHHIKQTGRQQAHTVDSQCQGWSVAALPAKHKQLPPKPCLAWYNKIVNTRISASTSTYWPPNKARIWYTAGLSCNCYVQSLQCE